ncbi:PTS sugar transporter subunit IIA, partial [Streptomyces cavourensis]
MFSLALTSFVTGVTEPIEFTFMFIAPVLYAIHAVLTGVSMALTWALGMKHGFGFSAGLTDFWLNFGIASKPWLLVLVGLCFAALYYVVFRFAITKFNLPTPGRESDEELAELQKAEAK